MEQGHTSKGATAEGNNSATPSNGLVKLGSSSIVKFWAQFFVGRTWEHESQDIVVMKIGIMENISILVLFSATTVDSTNFTYSQASFFSVVSYIKWSTDHDAWSNRKREKKVKWVAFEKLKHFNSYTLAGPSTYAT